MRWRDWNTDSLSVTVINGRVAKDQNHCGFRRALPYLGFDLPRNFVRDSINSTVLDGGRAILFRGFDHVRNRADTRPPKIDLGGVAIGTDCWRVLVVGR